MTSEHKIGLLLGLVFIFVIAFLINGLPSLKASAHGNELTYNMVNHQADTPGLAHRERQVGHSMESLDRSSGQATPADSPLTSSGDPQAEVRFSMPLPIPGSDVSRSVADVLRENQASIAERKRKRTQTGTQFYVVQSGDNLSTIAAKFYGQIIGNKLATVNTLFTVNKAVLPSPDEVRAGMKLTIPVITGVASQVLKTNRTEGGKAKSNARATATYTVKDGDSLWEIAADRLGDGSRWKEIVKLNQTVSLDNVKVIAGMRLKLPAK